MKQINYFILSGILISEIIGCSKPDKQANQKVSAKEIKRDSVVTAPIHNENKKDTLIIPPVSGIVELMPEEGIIKATIHKEKDQIIYIKFPSKDYKKLSARISSKDPKANIQISQIIMANGKMDGPFNNEIIYELPVKGSYALLIHENMMTGDPWKGNFTIEIHLTK